MKKKDKMEMEVDTNYGKTKLIQVDLPSNRNIDRGEIVDSSDKKIKRIVSNPVKKKKQGIVSRFLSLFINEDVDDVKSYVVNDIIIPSIKSTFADAVRGGIDMWLFGKGLSGSSKSGKSYVSYNSINKPTTSYNRNPRTTFNFDDFPIDDRRDAEAVLFQLAEAIDQFGSVTVADFYDSIGVTSDFTDAKYGWDDLGRTTISRGRNGYVINFPKPKAL